MNSPHDNPLPPLNATPDMEAQEQMNRRLRLAYDSVVAPPGLETRVRAAVRGEAPRARAWWTGFPAWATLAAVLVAGVSVSIAYQYGHLRFTRDSQNAYLASVSERVAAVLRPGLKDHIHCAIHRGIPKKPNPIEQSVSELGPEYKDLIEVVRKTAPKGFVLSTGHLCKTEGRQYAHLALTNGRQILSLIVAAKGQGETFLAPPIRPARSDSGTPFYEATAQKYAISAFETDRHLVYTVSDMAAEENMRVMVAMAPGVKNVLRPSL